MFDYIQHIWMIFADIHIRLKHTHKNVEPGNIYTMMCVAITPLPVFLVFLCCYLVCVWYIFNSFAGISRNAKSWMPISPTHITYTMSLYVTLLVQCAKYYMWQALTGHLLCCKSSSVCVLGCVGVCGCGCCDNSGRNCQPSGTNIGFSNWTLSQPTLI